MFGEVVLDDLKEELLGQVVLRIAGHLTESGRSDGSQERFTRRDVNEVLGGLKEVVRDLRHTDIDECVNDVPGFVVHADLVSVGCRRGADSRLCVLSSYSPDIGGRGLNTMWRAASAMAGRPATTSARAKSSVVSPSRT